MAQQYRREGALKRGGGRVRISIDEEKAEARLKNEMQADPGGSPDHLFERRWALMVLDRVLGHLEREYAQRGKDSEFSALSPHLAKPSGAASYADVASRLGVSEGSIRVAVFRMRKRYREILQREILATVASEDEVEAEIDHLFRVIT